MPQPTTQGRLIVMLDPALTSYQVKRLGALVREHPFQPRFTMVQGPHLAKPALIGGQCGTSSRNKRAWREVWIVRDGIVWDSRGGRAFADLNARPHQTMLRSISAARALDEHTRYIPLTL